MKEGSSEAVVGGGLGDSDGNSGLEGLPLTPLHPPSRNHSSSSADHGGSAGLGQGSARELTAVRRLTKTNMNDASAVRNEWCRLEILSDSAAVWCPYLIGCIGPVNRR